MRLRTKTLAFLGILAWGAAVTLSAPSPASPLTGSPVTLTVTPAAGTSPRVVMDWGDGTTTDLGVVTAAVVLTQIVSARPLHNRTQE